MFNRSRIENLNWLKDLFMQDLTLFNSKKCNLMLMNKNASFRSHQTCKAMINEQSGVFSFVKFVLVCYTKMF